ncbi:MAG: hypothetical protein OXU20_38440 [Myxococcales bacterium]|nr:hypothetical protein [Myxococcales bacterium]
MTADAQATRMTSHPSNRPYRRRIRNLLLEPRFQLKYTLMVVAVTVLVASALGAVAYNYSKGQTELLTIHRMERALDRGEEISPQFGADMLAYAAEADRRVLAAIVGGILALALALGLTGILVTHRLVGPAYRLRAMIGDVANGHWAVRGRLRKGDELQDIFQAFEGMVESLRAAQREEIALLDDAIQKAREAGVPEDAIAAIAEVRERMQSALDSSPASHSGRP